MQDYNWQIKAVARHAQEKISAIVAGCGTGKTRATIRIAMAKMLPVIVIAPGETLCRQWKDDILEIAGPDQKVWLYRRKDEVKEGVKYYERFLEWIRS